MGTIIRETHNSDWFVKNLGSGGMIFRKPRPKDSTDSSPDTQSAVPQSEAATQELTTPTDSKPSGDSKPMASQNRSEQINDAGNS